MLTYICCIILILYIQSNNKMFKLLRIMYKLATYLKQIKNIMKKNSKSLKFFNFLIVTRTYNVFRLKII